MKKYVVIDMLKDGDWFENVFDTEEQAVRQADKEWNHLTAFDKHRRLTFAVMVGELDKCECLDFNTAEVVKSYK